MACLPFRRTIDPAVVAEKWQQLQALIALGSGGLWGLGLGNSRQKMYWLPEVNTDFVFPIIGEELGMWVALARGAGFSAHDALRRLDHDPCAGHLAACCSAPASRS